MILFPSHRVEFCLPLAGRLLGCLVHSVYNCQADPSWLLDAHRPLSQACPCSSYRLTCVTLELTYCDRLARDTPFLMGHGRLSEQQVDRIILQLNRYHPQILSNSDAEKFRNPKASLRVRLCDLLGHLQRSGERDCQEFYRALYIHAQPLHSRLPSRLALQNSDCTELDSGTVGRELSDRGPVAFLACLGLAAGLALLVYCCPPDPKVLPGTRRVLGFSPIIVDRHVSRFLLAFLTDDLGGL
ncbi:caspase recruitment domain-containing protein 19 isoform X2 [Lynx rufus]|uniref:caspase recruitment domain-containing protein 19 isoform X2 n=1 Tax=Lynx rufus TaxID=61384 RepID=UPI001F126AE5|nr:caspase recruitment domain-containing protein 19 isoform X2 [Lynx rufus]